MALSDLRGARNLQRLRVTLVGARITCDFFKKAMSGLVSLPQLVDLTLDVDGSFRRPNGTLR